MSSYLFVVLYVRYEFNCLLDHIYRKEEMIRKYKETSIILFPKEILTKDYDCYTFYTILYLLTSSSFPCCFFYLFLKSLSWCFICFHSEWCIFHSTRVEISFLHSTLKEEKLSFYLKWGYLNQHFFSINPLKKWNKKSSKWKNRRENFHIVSHKKSTNLKGICFPLWLCIVDSTPAWWYY